jgi:hypothetical protein
MFYCGTATTSCFISVVVVMVVVVVVMVVVVMVVGESLTPRRE